MHSSLGDRVKLCSKNKQTKNNNNKKKIPYKPHVNFCVTKLYVNLKTYMYLNACMYRVLQKDIRNKVSKNRGKERERGEKEERIY